MNEAPHQQEPRAHAPAATPRLFPYARWQPRAAELRERYRSAAPFPHVHLTDFLDTHVCRRVAREFPAPGETEWIQYKHFNERKLGKSRREEFPPLIGRVVDELNSPAFVAWLSTLTGIPDLLADPSLEGGGMHQTEPGGFLNIHADFTVHHHRPGWRRRVNLILFLNEGWEDGWGGAIELWDRGVERCVVKVPPLLNHAVVFSTDRDSYHGYPDPIRCPPGTTRRSLALYYFTADADARHRPRATHYRARPGDGAKIPLIWLDQRAVALYSLVKQRLGLSDEFASRVLGRLMK